MKHDVWIAIGALTVICFAIKAAGPVALGGRDLPRWADRLIVLMPAALLRALVVVQTFARRQGAGARRPRGRARGGDGRARAARERAVVLLAAAATAAGLRALASS